MSLPAAADSRTRHIDTLIHSKQAEPTHLSDRNAGADAASKADNPSAASTTCDMRHATCDMRHAICDMRPASCDLRPATCADADAYAERRQHASVAAA